LRFHSLSFLSLSLCSLSALWHECDKRGIRE
jgi:hypothetical protein